MSQFKRLFNWLLKPFKKGKSTDSNNKLKVLSPNVKRKSKAETKYYRVDAVIEVNGHRLGVFPLTVVAENKSKVQFMISTNTKLIPTNIHEDKSHARRQTRLN